MNPHNPTANDMIATEQVFFNQMKMLSRQAWQSFDLQCSERWV